MSLALVYSRARAGVEAPLVRVEVHLSGGLPATQIVGLAETSVRESRERVRAALLCARFDFPQRRITLNLAPADLPKEGGYLQLPRTGTHPYTYHGQTLHLQSGKTSNWLASFQSRSLRPKT